MYKDNPEDLRKEIDEFKKEMDLLKKEIKANPKQIGSCYAGANEFVEKLRQ